MEKGHFPDPEEQTEGVYHGERGLFRDNYYKGVIEELSPSHRPRLVANQRLPRRRRAASPSSRIRCRRPAKFGVGTVVTVHAPDGKPDVHDVMVGATSARRKKTEKRPLGPDSRASSPSRARTLYDVIYEDGEEPQREYEGWNHARVARQPGAVPLAVRPGDHGPPTCARIMSTRSHRSNHRWRGATPTLHLAAGGDHTTATWG